ncbi:MAG: helix-turn-helix transcriptional regulator [Propionibacteriaceae bacterium]|nr:helix-turn-helix transcriptional regulator [Propionibacteriaceae bacterium]
MFTLEGLLGLDASSASMVRAAQLAENDRALLRNLVEIRRQRGLTQSQVAEILGVKQPTIAKFEAHDSNPTLASIRRYAHAVEALVNHDVAADTGQLMNPGERGRWIATSLRASTHVAYPRAEHVWSGRLVSVPGDAGQDTAAETRETYALVA